MANWTFLAADLRTNAGLAELPLTQGEFERRVSAYGQWSATVSLADPKYTSVDLIGATQPARTTLYVIRDNTPLYGGIIWQRSYDSSRQELTLRGSEFWSYWHRRRIRRQLAYTNADEITVFRGLLGYGASVPGGDIGMTVGGDTSSGVLMSRTYTAAEDKNLGDACVEIATQYGGFDFASDVAWTGGNIPGKILTIDFPRRGNTAYATGWVWEFGGLGSNTDVKSYTFDEDGYTSANSLIGVGTGSGSQTLTSAQSDTAPIDSGYPLLEDSFSMKDASTQLALNAATATQLGLLEWPVINGELLVQANLDPVLGDYTVGDEFRLRITDPRFPAPAAGGPGLDAFYRCIGMRIRPPLQSQPEEVSILYGPTL